MKRIREIAWGCTARIVVTLVMLACGAVRIAPGQSASSSSGSLQIYATPVAVPVTIDGHLTEDAWQTARAVSRFRQIDPDQGEPASFDTRVKMIYDDRYLYIGAVCYDTSGTRGVRAPDLRRDFSFSESDVFGVTIDPFGDGRHAMSFQVNPFGAQRDLLISDGVTTDDDWVSVWRVRTQISDTAWTVEMAIPWSSLRYPDIGKSDWSINFVRIIRRSNEMSGWSVWPRAYSPFRSEYAGTLAGLNPPPPSTNLRIQPYFVYRGERYQTQEDPEITHHDLTPVLGGDVKWAINTHTVLDLTVNTDFAQAEVDDQILNFSRFSVFLPEKRQFFLENSSLFATGWLRRLQPFFSRRIGLDSQNHPIPLNAGVRLSSRQAGRSFGGMIVQQGSNEFLESSTFGVGRYIQNIGSLGRVGGILVMRRDESTRNVPPETNAVTGVDWFVRPTSAFTVQGLASRSFTAGLPGGTGFTGDGYAGFVWLAYATNWFQANHIQTVITEQYHAAAGFVMAQNAIVSAPAFSFDFRPNWLPASIRSFNPLVGGLIVHRASDRRLQQIIGMIDVMSLSLHSGTSLALILDPEYQYVDVPFDLLDIRIDPGEYKFVQYGLAFQPDMSGAYPLSFRATTGTYYGGTRSMLSARTVPIRHPHMSLSASYEGNWLVDVGQAGTATTHLLAGELRVSLNPRIHATAVYQYNTYQRLATISTRFSYEISPLSYIYLVYNDSDPMDHRSVFSRQQQAIFKLTYLHQF